MRGQCRKDNGMHPWLAWECVGVEAVFKLPPTPPALPALIDSPPTKRPLCLHALLTRPSRGGGAVLQVKVLMIDDHFSILKLFCRLYLKFHLNNIMYLVQIPGSS